MALGPGTLKRVIWSSSREDIEGTLRSHVGDGDVLRVRDGTFLVYADADPAAIRDWLLPIATDVLVIEFERWSARGAAIDRDWLTRRGH